MKLNIRLFTLSKGPAPERPGSGSSFLRPLTWLFPVLFLCFLQAAWAETNSRTTNGAKIVILKEEQLLQLYINGNPVKSYRVCLGINPSGPKRVMGDQKTPEGEYVICYKSESSRFHRFLGLSYPSAGDAQASFENGLISLDELHSLINTIRDEKAPPWDSKLGGWVGIHGYPTNGNQRRWISLLYPKPHNWTDGCIAMWNFEIDELYSRVSVGTPVSIRP
ncbi:MAG: L,D-transpeptidase family protein [Desulfomonile tiedjei]|nr:L,D-transpeptidase family protein [Desulfomonile tiedjei]